MFEQIGERLVNVVEDAGWEASGKLEIMAAAWQQGVGAANPERDLHGRIGTGRPDDERGPALRRSSVWRKRRLRTRP